jgi:hypothetical protein
MGVTDDLPITEVSNEAGFDIRDVGLALGVSSIIDGEAKGGFVDSDIRRYIHTQIVLCAVVNANYCYINLINNANCRCYIGRK